MKFNELLQLLEYTEETKGKEWAMFLDGLIPLSPSIMKRLNKVKEDYDVYHATDVNGLKNLIKLQGKSKGISTTTIVDDMIQGGIDTKGGIIVKLTGTSIFHAAGDAWTTKDRNGMRWINTAASTVNNMMTKYYFILKLVEDIKKITRDIAVDVFDIDIKNHEDITPNQLGNYMDSNGTGKLKHEFIKRCFDEVEKRLTIFDWDKFGNLFLVPYANDDFIEYNECILTKFKINDITLVNMYEEKTNTIEVFDLFKKIKNIWKDDIYVIDYMDTKPGEDLTPILEANRVLAKEYFNK